MSKRQKVETFLTSNFDFRYNVLTGSILYKEKGKEEYSPHGDYEMNSIIRKIDSSEDLAVSESLYYSIIKSDFTPRFHPLRHYFHDYLFSVEYREGAIKELAETVQVPNSSVLELSLKRWLIASVANALTEKGCQNHTCLVFTGGMGLFKTTWLDMLCPPSLAPDNIYTGKIDLSLQNKDTFTLLGIKFIINLDDQLRNLMKKDSETMKTLITQPEISIRRPFAKFHETLPRIGNFLASINGEEFLAENQNRRFLPFRVRGIDIEKAKSLNMDEVWKEAYVLWKNGVKYWWNEEELNDAFPDMNSFTYATDELESITTYFEIPESKHLSNCFMNATEIASYLKSVSGMIASTKKIGEALKSMGAIVHSVREGNTTVKKYALIRKDLAVPVNPKPPF